MPFASLTLGAEQPLLASELLSLGRDPIAPVKDAITAEGDIVVPVDARFARRGVGLSRLAILYERVEQRGRLAHLGHFASTYRRVYGEAPSDTLRRRITLPRGR